MKLPYIVLCTTMACILEAAQSNIAGSTVPCNADELRQEAKNKLVDLIRSIDQDPLLIHEVNTRYPQRTVSFTHASPEIEIELHDRIDKAGMVLLKKNLPFESKAHMQIMISSQRYDYYHKKNRRGCIIL